MEAEREERAKREAEQKAINAEKSKRLLETQLNAVIRNKDEEILELEKEIDVTRFAFLKI